MTGTSTVWLRGACQISEWWHNFEYKYRGFETLRRDLTITRLIRYWNGVPYSSRGINLVMPYHGTGSGLLLKSLLTIKITGQNVDKPKRRQPKRRQTKRRQTETSTDRNVDRPNRRHTETSTNQNVERPKRRRTKTSTNLNVDTPFHYWLRPRRSPFNFGLKVRSSLTLRMGVYWIYRLLECLIKSCN